MYVSRKTTSFITSQARSEDHGVRMHAPTPRAQSTANVTSTFPRVAFEYGHSSCAAATSALAAARSMPGREMSISTAMPKPVPRVPKETRASTACERTEKDARVSTRGNQADIQVSAQQAPRRTCNAFGHYEFLLCGNRLHRPDKARRVTGCEIQRGVCMWVQLWMCMCASVSAVVCARVRVRVPACE